MGMEIPGVLTGNTEVIEPEGLGEKDAPQGGLFAALFAALWQGRPPVPPFGAGAGEAVLQAGELLQGLLLLGAEVSPWSERLQGAPGQLLLEPSTGSAPGEVPSEGQADGNLPGAQPQGALGASGTELPGELLEGLSAAQTATEQNEASQALVKQRPEASPPEVAQQPSEATSQESVLLRDLGRKSGDLLHREHSEDSGGGNLLHSEGLRPWASAASDVLLSQGSGHSEADPLRTVRAEELHDVVRVLTHRGGGRMHVRLHPPELGAVQIQVRLDRSEVHVRFEVEHSTTQALLLRTLGDLRDHLVRSGFSVGGAEVFLSGGESQSGSGGTQWGSGGGFSPEGFEEPSEEGEATAGVNIEV